MSSELEFLTATHVDNHPNIFKQPSFNLRVFNPFLIIWTMIFLSSQALSSELASVSLQ